MAFECNTALVISSSIYIAVEAVRLFLIVYHLNTQFNPMKKTLTRFMMAAALIIPLVVGVHAQAQVGPSFAAEDFGVVNYDTGLGILKGYTAGFGLTNATFASSTSVVVQLYSSSTLLQTNIATPKVAAEITGNQISSPFDVSGTFDYVTDGYWTNVRSAQYGQSLPATRVVATVTLADGTVLTAENTILTGDLTTIYPVITPPPVVPTTKDQCKDGGWKTFTHPSFKNQGQCVSSVAKARS